MAFWTRKKNLRSTDTESDPTPIKSESTTQAELAKAKAEADLLKAQAQSDEVIQVAAKLNDQFVRNHFTEMLEQSFARRGA